MFIRQVNFAAITPADAGFWIVAFWSSIAVAVQGGDYGSLGPLAALRSVGAAVALLLPMSGSRKGERRWLTMVLLAVFLAVVAFVRTALILNTAAPITAASTIW